jgi:BirA family biotin operon repressor/biotin-[acetyl-CoA-carboxylase] ligase
VTSPPSRYADLDRPPLRGTDLGRACQPPWTAVELYDEVESTNHVAADAARDGKTGLVVVAELQTGGRGRLGRQWVSPPRAGLTLSMLVRPVVPAAHWPWLPGLVCVAAARALRERTEVDVRLKWPNDLVVADRKLGGLLAEAVDSAVVIGIGINVTTRPAELPRPDATSLAMEGAVTTDRLPLLLALLRQVGTDYLAWSAAGGDPDAVLSAYRELCTTIGRRVRVELPGGSAVEGEAVDVDARGHLVVDVGGAHRAVAAADVVHLRPAGG